MRHANHDVVVVRWPTTAVNPLFHSGVFALLLQ